MYLNDLLGYQKIDPANVLVLRHRPFEPDFNKVFSLLAADRTDLFEAYQQSQGVKLEKAMSDMIGTGYIASFIACGAGKALFIGLYKIAGAVSLTHKQYWARPLHRELKTLGMQGFTDDRPAIKSFDLRLVDFYPDWKGKLVVDWPPPERSWWRRAERNQIPVYAILERAALDTPIMDWRKIDLSWPELGVLPLSWKTKLSEWRAIYYIFDGSDGKGYVGSAYGAQNLLGRWMNYAASGHGGNRLLRQRDRSNLRFSILERVSPDTQADEIIGRESTWKDRLHTRAPFGLNDN